MRGSVGFAHLETFVESYHASGEGVRGQHGWPVQHPVVGRITQGTRPMLSMPACGPIPNAHDDGMIQARRIIEGCVAARLRQSPYPSLRRISCRLGDSALILRGRVPSYYMKQVAQIVAFSVDGVSVVQNELEVYRTSSTLEGR